MILQTKIPRHQQQHHQIDYSSKLCLLGSCFTENMSQKFDYFKFQNLTNPFGILFHPLAIENLITNAINEKQYTSKDVFSHNERWHCFEAHSKLSDTSKETLLHILNANIKLMQLQLKEATHIVITLGTAWMYRFIETDAIVANCHKLPQKKFVKELMAVDEITHSLQAITSLIRTVNPDVSLIVTVSPVRHLKDGFAENSLSKAHLISAIHQVVAAHEKLHYFPSFEIMLDELRDYRFYEEDMLHPNATAINYIWEKFQDTWIASNAYETMKEIAHIQKGLGHKPFNPNSEAHQDFLRTLELKKEQIQKSLPHIVF